MSVDKEKDQRPVSRASRIIAKPPNLMRIFEFVRNYFFLILFPIKNLSRLTNKDLYQLISSEVFAHYGANGAANGRPKGYFRREWTRLAWLAMEGTYRKANAGRADLINEARSIYGLPDHYEPMILEKGWTTHYGHLGCLINFRNAQQLGIINSGRRQVLRGNNYSYGRPIYRLLSKDFDFINCFSGESIFETEPLFPLTDKVSFTSTAEGFKDVAEFFSLVSQRQNQGKNFKRETLEFLDRELNTIEALFHKHGYRHDHPFVAIHIRETRDKYSARDSIASHFLPAIKSLVGLGMPVLRIGSPQSSPLPSIPGLIDLRDAPASEQQFLHDFAISNCKYFISSQSGPTAISHALGVPTLTVDGLAIARYSYTTSALSMTLPKFWIDSRGHRLSYENVFDFGLGFRELASSPSGYHLQNNSPVEIMLAVQEFSRLVDSPQSVHANPSGFQELKESFGGVGDGLISEVFFSV